MHPTCMRKFDLFEREHVWLKLPNSELGIGARMRAYGAGLTDRVGLAALPHDATVDELSVAFGEKATRANSVNPLVGFRIS